VSARCFFGLLAVWIGSTAAAPPLTTIQDVLYKADGTAFSGTLFIEWRSFQAADYSAIATHSLSVPVVDGVLRVQLVPTTNATPPAMYSVRYNSGGRIQFEERWAVPPSAVPLKLRDVRMSGSGAPGTVTPPPALTEIQESHVVGLLNDLAIRPVKGQGYAPSRAAFIGPSGTLEAVVGNLTDCVRVDGSAGACGISGGGGPAFMDGETPAGLVNGSNATFTLSNVPGPPDSLALYRNGLLQAQGLDYTIDANVITFATASRPQPGDILLAAYRLADAGNPPGHAGGALTGTYPNPSIAAGVISDINIAEIAGIRESKLGLNHPTHSNANDPTPEQRGALAGTSGVPSVANRFVTDQDPRMSDARTPQGHTLLGPGHSDTAAGALARGDLVVGQGNPAAWSRLPLGPANRCLMSNGADAVWNTCLFTGFAAGSIPFVDASGNLAQNNTRLLWDNANRRLSVGNNTGQATLYLYDGAPSIGMTGLTVRAGQGQGAEPLQRWLDPNGVELARLDASGHFAGASIRAATSETRAAWRDTGSAVDPSARADGDVWFNSFGQARKTVESNQVHTLPQVLCSSSGTFSSATALTRLGSCAIPAGLLKAGDRIELRFDYSHEGTTTDFSFEVRWGGASVARRSASAAELLATGRADVAIHTAGAQWSAQSWGSSLAAEFEAGTASEAPAAPVTVDFLGQMGWATTETITLRAFTVVRYPAQANP
jgi:hypothetical protein